METNSSNASGLTPLQAIAYEAVREIIDMKQGAVEPCMAHINEIRNSINVELTEALRELCRNGLLTVSLDLNKKPMFKFPQKDKMKS